MNGPVIDFHAHIGVPAVDALVSSQPAFFEHVQRENAVMGEQSVQQFLTLLPELTRALTDLEHRLSQMDERGVDVQVLSVNPVQYHYWADPELSVEIARAVNSHIATVCAAHPTRFVGLGTVPLQHPDIAVGILREAVNVNGLEGVQISTSAQGRELADPVYGSFWAAAADLGAIVFIHPWGCSLGTRLTAHYLTNIVGQPLETTIALSHLIFGGVLNRHPRLKIVAAHGGGYLPAYPGRSDHGYRVRPESRTAQYPPRHYLRQIYVDSLVYDDRCVRQLLETIGEEHLLLGTDYPFDMGVSDISAGLGQLTDSQRAAVLGGNAAALLGLSDQATKKGNDDGTTHGHAADDSSAS
ncbi:amidohydrolase family protein [Nocardia asiatica]|uniref:amidohydrolase family protein n=1 Tax=Nocardia asiatica TaxID=209252 RepID=UPI002458F829|nr:amidohydrolase family protein [Nocardia asiatica]